MYYVEVDRRLHAGVYFGLVSPIADHSQVSLSLRGARRHAGDVLVYDNTPDGKGHRLVARFIAGELVNTTHTSPEWLKNLFGRELEEEGRQRERSRGR